MFYLLLRELGYSWCAERGHVQRNTLFEELLLDVKPLVCHDVVAWFKVVHEITLQRDEPVGRCSAKHSRDVAEDTIGCASHQHLLNISN